ncbi:MAG: formate dehydrogenase accessory sulfurtransferase FdhD, partial [Pseudomonadota bacterium]
MMRIPIVISRSGFTALAIKLAKKCDLTLIGRARGHRFIALSAWHRIIFDRQEHVDEPPEIQRKSSRPSH